MAQSQKWDPKFPAETVRRYALQTRKAMAAYSPALVIWPETAMPFFFQEKSALEASVRRVAARGPCLLLFGAPGYLPETGDGYMLFNRAYLLDRQGQTVGFYEKEHLVPFGEYVPMEEYLPFIDKLVQAVGDFYPGVHTAPITAADLSLGVLVCYETIFPELSQKQVAQGANVLVNISNDAWFGRSSAPLQHLHLTLLRAVEQGRWLIRSTNTGVSAIIDARGRIKASSSLFVAQRLDAEVELRSQTTFFHRHYDLVRLSIVGLALLLAFWAAFSTVFDSPTDDEDA